MAPPGGEHRSDIPRALLSPGQRSRFPVGLPASNARRADGHWRLGLADGSVHTTHRPPVTLQRNLGLHRRRIVNALAPSDGRERSTMQGHQVIAAILGTFLGMIVAVLSGIGSSPKALYRTRTVGELPLSWVSCSKLTHSGMH